MKGIVFNLLEGAVVRSHGTAAWRALRAASGYTAEYQPQQDYGDDELTRLVGVASNVLDLPPFEVLRWLGHEMAPQLAQAYPELFGSGSGRRSFTSQIEAILQPQAAAASAARTTPVCSFEVASDGGLVMRYSSARRLCALAQGFVEGVAQMYGQEVVIEHRLCMLRGDTQCLCVIYFSAGMVH